MNTDHAEYLLEGEQAGANYSLAAPRHVPLGLSGLHLGRQAGASLEFKDHREYQPGDDLRRIDWPAFARSDRLVVKLYREEIDPHLDLLLDASLSMALHGTAKARAALGLAAAFAAAAANSGYTHAAWLARRRCEAVAHGRERPSTWEGIEFDSPVSPADALQQAPPRWRSHGVRVLISDLLWLGEPLATLERLGRGASTVCIVQLLAEEDVSPPQRGNLRLVDCETDVTKEVFVDATAESRYREALARHQENWNNAARQSGARMVTLVAETLVAGWNLADLVAGEMMVVA